MPNLEEFRECFERFAGFEGKIPLQKDDQLLKVFIGGKDDANDQESFLQSLQEFDGNRKEYYSGEKYKDSAIWRNDCYI